MIKRWRSWAVAIGVLVLLLVLANLVGCAATGERIEYTDPDGGVWSCWASRVGDCDPVAPPPQAQPAGSWV